MALSQKPPEPANNPTHLSLVSNESVNYHVGIYLLKKQYIQEAKNKLQEASEGKWEPLVATIPNGFFIKFLNEDKLPKWIDFISILLPNSIDLNLKSKQASAALWIPIDDKVFILAFGHAHSKIEDEWGEPEFGKNVALCLIPKNEFTAISANQVFARGHKTDENAPDSTDLNKFGFDQNRDLVEAVKGIVEKNGVTEYGVKIRGGRALNIEVNSQNLIETLKFLAEKFESNEHESRHPDLHKLVRVKDKEKINSLDECLEKMLEADPSKIKIAAPSAGQDNFYPERFIIGTKSKNAVKTPYVTLHAWKSHLSCKRPIKHASLDEAKKTNIHCINEEDDDSKVIKFYNLMSTEIEANGLHILHDGSWFKANHDHVKEINDYLSEHLKSPSYSLCKWDGNADEDIYNQSARDENPQNLALFDAKNIHYGGGQSKFEFCDLMHQETKTLYFVKNISRSANASHLCEQIKCTQTNFFNPDNTFRKKLKAKIEQEQLLYNASWLNQRPLNHEWNFCLVSMGRNLEDMPFFAKNSIYRMAKSLLSSGHKISFQKV
jgi:uncharacterized protein (TIGR04141 family)